MEENKDLLTEGRLADTVSYKNFLNADPEFKVEMVDNHIQTSGLNNIIKVSHIFYPYKNRPARYVTSQDIEAAKQARKEAFNLACKTIRAIEKEMLNAKPNALNDTINRNI